MFGFFIIRKLFDISCLSDHVQPISKPLSVVLGECGHFVVTWSVQGIFMWSLGMCRIIPATVLLLLCGHIGLNKTNHRNRLGISTLNSLLIVQFNVPKKCYELTEHY